MSLMEYFCGLCVMHRSMPCHKSSGENEESANCYGKAICDAEADFECGNFMDTWFPICDITFYRALGQ